MAIERQEIETPFKVLIAMFIRQNGGSITVKGFGEELRKANERDAANDWDNYYRERFRIEVDQDSGDYTLSIEAVPGESSRTQ